MKIVSTIARYLLGVIFLFFGSNLFLNFLHAPMPTGTAGDFFGALFASHYIYVVAFFQVVAAILLIVNRYVPLALIVLAPLVVGILFFHILMSPSGLPLALVVIFLWILAALPVRSAFAGLLQAKVNG
jgi:hypothetical protein